MSKLCIGCFKQTTAYEMRSSDWSSDVCSSDLLPDMAVGFAPRRSAIKRDARAGQFEAIVGARAIGAVARAGEDHRAHRVVGVALVERSEARRGGKACVCTCRSRRWPYH